MEQRPFRRALLGSKCHAMTTVVAETSSQRSIVPDAKNSLTGLPVD